MNIFEQLKEKKTPKNVKQFALYIKSNDVKENDQPVKPVTYSVVKHGIIGLTKYLATYSEYKNIRSNAICSSGIFNDTKNVDKDFISKLKNTIPLNRLAKSNDICSTLLWLLSDSADFVNGSIIMVDGGRSTW